MLTSPLTAGSFVTRHAVQLGRTTLNFFLISLMLSSSASSSFSSSSVVQFDIILSIDHSLIILRCSFPFRLRLRENQALTVWLLDPSSKQEDSGRTTDVIDQAPAIAPRLTVLVPRCTHTASVPADCLKLMFDQYRNGARLLSVFVWTQNHEHWPYNFHGLSDFMKERPTQNIISFFFF